jgi:hypothetical protein
VPVSSHQAWPLIALVLWSVTPTEVQWNKKPKFIPAPINRKPSVIFKKIWPKSKIFCSEEDEIAESNNLVYEF